MRFAWKKSSYSGGDGGQCIEVGAAWRKSSYSGGTGGQCVEVAATPYAIGIRDTKNRTQGHLTVSPATWRSFTKSRYVAGT